jgi:hypothetical protein
MCPDKIKDKSFLSRYFPTLEIYSAVLNCNAAGGTRILPPHHRYECTTLMRTVNYL